MQIYNYLKQMLCVATTCCILAGCGFFEKEDKVDLEKLYDNSIEEFETWYDKEETKYNNIISTDEILEVITKSKTNDKLVFTASYDNSSVYDATEAFARRQLFYVGRDSSIKMAELVLKDLDVSDDLIKKISNDFEEAEYIDTWIHKETSDSMKVEWKYHSTGPDNKKEITITIKLKEEDN